ncbi:MAG: class I SAM-dependent methyltransferase [Leeuwenhoekiella sp.]
MKEKIKLLLGRILLVFNRKEAAALAKNGMTISWNNELTFKERLLRHALLKNAERDGNFDQLAGFHHDYWKKQGGNYFSRVENILQDFFKPKCEFVFDQLIEILEAEPREFNVLVEIGTGNGDVLNYLSKKMVDLERCVGIDLSEEQTIKNIQKYSDNSKLEFVAADALGWIKEYATDEMIFFTSRGVLEYFTQNQMIDLLTHLNTLQATVFIAIEPIGDEIDFIKNPNSQTYGSERSFSHNYTKLFTDAGFKIWHNSTIPCPDLTWDFEIIGAKH